VYTGEALAHYPEALRELSLVLCSGLARMVEQVPAREPVTFRREYLGEWHTPDTADAMAYALQASTALERQSRLLGYGKCSMHTEFYAGCLTCQQARYRHQREQRTHDMRKMFTTMPLLPMPEPELQREPARNRIMISRDGIKDRAAADQFRGMAQFDWHILGTFNEWFRWGDERGLELLQYFVVEVLAPGGGKVTADDGNLAAKRWWPR
jgi:hypothetical protein